MQESLPPPTEVPGPAQAPASEVPVIVTSATPAKPKKEPEFVFPAVRDSAALVGDAPISAEVEPNSPMTSEGAPLDFAFTNKGRPAKTSSPEASGKKPPGRKKKSLAPLLIGGGVLGLVVLITGSISLTLMLGGFGGPAARPKSKQDKAASLAAAGKAVLVLDWPEQERRGAAISIDGKRMALPASGEARFTLNPGPKKLLLQRRGFANVETTLPLASGETARFAPKWEEVLASGPKKVDGSSESSPTGTNFPIGGAAPSTDASFSPQGFAGWFQLLDSAERQARANKKELLIVFGSSDADSDTQKLAKDLDETQTKAAVSASFVPVIIDFPQTARGHRNIEDAHQNQNLARQYGIRKIPAVVLADEKGLPYFIEREWKSSMSVSKNLESWKQKRAERDKLLVAARTGNDATRMNAAEKALAWLKQQQLLSVFADDVRTWYALAQRIDAANGAGKLEAFAEADVLLRLRDVRIDEEESVIQALAPLKEWMGKKRFVDPDRGASLHLLAASVLLNLDRDDDGLKHLEEAATYDPKDTNLKDKLLAAKSMLKNRNVRSSGTGFVISEGGYLLTNHHVVEGEGQVIVRLKGVEQPLPATVIAEDANRDMALIKIEPPAGMKLVPVGLSADKTGRGAAVIAFGYPLIDRTGEGLKLTEGVISALPDQDRKSMFLLDMRVNPGNSGGPLCDRKGNVVGMVTAKTTGDFEGLEDTYGMAIPTPDLLKFLEQHLPKDAPAVPPAGSARLSTEEVDERVSPAVILILKMK